MRKKIKLSKIDWSEVRPSFREWVEKAVQSNPDLICDRLRRESDRTAAAEKVAREKANAAFKAYMDFDGDLMKWYEDVKSTAPAPTSIYEAQIRANIMDFAP